MFENTSFYVELQQFLGKYVVERIKLLVEFYLSFCHCIVFQVKAIVFHFISPYLVYKRNPRFIILNLYSQPSLHKLNPFHKLHNSILQLHSQPHQP
jgi:hypothetical protein